MGNNMEQVTTQRFKNQKLLQCTHCKLPFNTKNRIPKMVCSNQHNLCEQCLQQLKPKHCLECRQMLWIKRGKNVVLCHLLDVIQGKNDNKMVGDTSYLGKAQKRYETLQPDSYRITDSPSKRAIKLKTVKQQSIPNLNMEMYNEDRQFKKKYSVANFFSMTRLTDQIENKKQSFDELLARLGQEYHISAFKEIIETKKDPSTITNLDLTLCKIPTIFDFLPKFTSLTRLSLNKNRISKIQNLEKLISLTYLSLSDNHIEQIEGIYELVNLKNLYVSKNRLERIWNLDSLIELQFLGLSSNSIPNINGLQHLLELKWLNLELNYITKIGGIGHLKKLETIHLGFNQITAFQGFDELPALQEIFIQSNKIENVGKALSMKHLRKLKLDGNPGLKEDNTKEYRRLLEFLDTKGQSIQKLQQGCLIY